MAKPGQVIFTRCVLDGAIVFVDPDAYKNALIDKKKGVSAYKDERGTQLLRVVTIDRLKLALKKCVLDNGRGGFVFVKPGTNLRGVRGVIQAYKDEKGAELDRSYASHRLTWA